MYSPPWQEMTTSIAERSAMLVAFLTVVACLPTDGAGVPACDVEKKWGSTRSKSLLAHALHEDRADHTAPADDANPHDLHYAVEKVEKWKK